MRFNESDRSKALDDLSIATETDSNNKIFDSFVEKKAYYVQMLFQNINLNIHFLANVTQSLLQCY